MVQCDKIFRGLFLLLFCLLAINISLFADVAERLKTLTGKERVKIVFTWQKEEAFGQPGSGGALFDEKLLGYDSKTGKIDTLQSTPANYQRPLIIHDGSKVVYSQLADNNDSGEVYIVDWEKNATPVKICRGYAGALWFDTASKKEYIIYSFGNGSDDKFPIHKRCIQNPDEDTIIFNRTKIHYTTSHWLCVSSDLMGIGNIWGWGHEGAKVFSSSGFQIVSGAGGQNGGCWATMPYDTSRRLIRLGDEHDRWLVFGPSSGTSTGIQIGEYLFPDMLEHLKFATYSSNIMCCATGIGDSQKGGRVTIMKLDSTLCNITDSVTLNNDFRYGFPDLWSGANESTPSTISLVSPSDNAVNVAINPVLSWNRLNSATQYRLQVSTDPLFSTFTIHDSTLTDSLKQCAGLANGTIYYWRVTATVTNGTVEWSSVRNFTTEAIVPTAVSLVSPADNATNVAINPVLSWSRMSNATLYRLQVSTDPLFSTFFIHDSTLTDTTKQCTGFANGTKYYWRVMATVSSGTADWSSVRNFTTEAIVPTAVSLVSPADNATNVAINPVLSWNRMSNATLYRLQVSTDPLFSTFIIHDSTLTDTTKLCAGLANGTKYYWRVTATLPSSTVEWSSARNFTIVANIVPTAVSLLFPLMNDTIRVDSVKLQWSKPKQSTDRYWGELCTDSLFTTTEKDTNIHDTFVVVRALRNIYNNKTLWWRIKAHDTTTGWGEWSAKYSFTVKIPPPPVSSNDLESLLPDVNTFSISGSTGKILYRLPREANVTLQIYSLNGQMRSELVNMKQKTGNYSIDLQNSNLTSGSYMIVFNAGDFQQKKLISLTR